MKAKRSKRGVIAQWLQNHGYSQYGPSYYEVVRISRPPKQIWVLYWDNGGGGWTFSAFYYNDTKWELCVIGVAAEIEPIVVKRLQLPGIVVSFSSNVNLDEMPRLRAEMLAQELVL
jgi:hypothetical protein